MTETVNQNASSSNTSSYAWLVWSCPVFFYFFQFAVRVSPSVLADDIMADMGIHACAMGALASWYYIGYTGMQIPVGLMMDRVGVRFPLFAAALMCAVGCYIFASTDSLTLMSIGRFLMGIGSAFGFLSCVKTASLWFPPARLGMIIGLTMMIGTMGAIFAGAPLSELVEHFGWRNSVQILTVTGLILAIYCVTVVRDHETQIEVKAQAKESDEHWMQHVKESLKEVLLNKYTYIFGLYGGMMYVQLSGFADLWGDQFIAQTYGEDKSLSSAAVKMIYIGIAAGAPLSAMFADYIKSYVKVLLGGALGGCVLFTLHLYGYHFSFENLYIVYFIIGLCAGAQFLGFAAVCAANCKSKTGIASGVHNMMCMTSGIIFQPLIGFLLDINWDGKLVDNAPFYSQSDYDLAMFVVPASLIIATVSCFFMKETYGQDQEV